MALFWNRQLSGAGFSHGVGKGSTDQPNHANMVPVSGHTTSAHSLLAKASHMVESKVSERVVSDRH